MLDWIGWTATATFVVSYLCTRVRTMQRIQALGACLWLVYGFLLHSAPLIVANVAVGAAALYSSLRKGDGAVSEAS